ncbi:MAG: tetratricopeptide repeat protein [Nostoc sp. EfeVER01]|uniref:tetratricopeptide repeat protein n=1 Tax=unclassified Nostoc TaxID=2593658 RepID=UPI002AD3FA4C|nr:MULTISPECIES: tetratricopeptide repeat protein [unclassified Nostoc]MDZ7948007.1 tetratricopeptide repeat protein [Nostoc sp. EfeVER01]MDZ7991374.1 tetratricopeptide repeat protein [Nostoc sp. EspVER01]
MNSQNNKYWSFSFKLILIITVIITGFNTYKIMHIWEPLLRGEPLPNSQTNNTSFNDEQFDKMLERNHRIHDMIESHVFSLVALIIGTGGTVLIFGAKNWIYEEVKKDLDKEKQDYKTEIQKYLDASSQLMVLMPLISDEEIYSSESSIEIKALSTIWKKSLETIKEKYPEYKATSMYALKAGDMSSYIARLSSEEAGYKKDISIQKKAQEMYEQARKEYQESLQYIPIKMENIESVFWSKIQCRMGNVLTALKRYQDAEISYEDSLKNMPSNYWAWHSLGDLFANQKQYEYAITKYDEALKIYPNHPETLYKKGIALSSSNPKGEQTDIERQAIDLYKKALTFRPTNNWLLKSLGDSLQKLWWYENRKSNFKVETKEEQEQREKKEKEISETYQKAIDANFNKYESLLEYGDFLLKSAYCIDRRMGNIHADAKKKRIEAIEKYKSAWEIAKRLEHNTVDILYARGNAELYNGDYEAAYNLYEEAISENEITKDPTPKEGFNNYFRNWDKPIYAIIKLLESTKNNDEKYEKIRVEWSEKALETFNNKFKKTLLNNNQDMSDVSEKIKKVEALYNKTILLFFKLEGEDARKELEKARNIDKDYLTELQNSDLDWGLFFFLK